MSLNAIVQPLTYWFRTAAYNHPHQGDDAEWKLQVVGFDGVEAISNPYRYTIDLVSREAEVQFSEIINRPGQLVLERRVISSGSEKTTSFVNGIVTEFEMTGRTSYWYHYRAVLRPRMWLLSMTRRSRIFSNRSVPEIIRMVLEEGDVFQEISLVGRYPVRETVVQHHETDLAFLHRIAAREGIRFVFEQDDQRDTVHVIDAPGKSPLIDEDADGHTELPFEDAEGASIIAKPEVVGQAFAAERTVTQSARVQDYNYRTPSAGLEVTDVASGNGGWEGGGEGEIGLYQEFGTHHKDAADGVRMAQIRRERLHTFRRTLTGQSTCTRFRAGQRFGLSGHYRASLDGDFLLVAVHHQGRQAPAFFGEGQARLRESADDRATGPEYRNVYGAVPAATPYRPSQGDDLRAAFPAVFAGVPERALADVLGVGIDRTVEVGGADAGTGWGGGRMMGLMTATLTGDGSYGAVDDQGRYVMDPAFPHEGGSTHAARMVQPYAGRGSAGFHFPTHAGNEVIYACLDGDPDRPVILGPVPNPDHEAPVTSANSSQHVFRTTSQNEFVVEDREGEERIALATPWGQSRLTLGSRTDNVDGAMLTTKEDLFLNADKGTTIRGGGGVIISAVDGVMGGLTATLVAKAITPAIAAAIAVASSAFTETPEPVSKFGKIAQGLWDKFDIVKGVGVSVGETVGMNAAKGSGAKTVSETILGLLDRPGIYLGAQGGIDIVCVEGMTTIPAGGWTVITPLSAGITALADVSLVAGQNVGIFARTGVVDVLSHDGDVRIEAIQQSLKLLAEKKVTMTARTEDMALEAETTNFLAKAKEKVMLEATGNDVLIDAKSTSILATAKQKVMVDGGDKIDLTSGASSATLEKGGTITLKVGASSIKITSSAIELTSGASSLKLQSSGTVEVKGVNVTVQGMAAAKLTAPMADLNGTAMAKVSAPMIMIG